MRILCMQKWKFNEYLNLIQLLSIIILVLTGQDFHSVIPAFLWCLPMSKH